MPSFSTTAIVLMFLSALICIAVPVVSAVVLHQKKGAAIVPFFIGCGIFILFSQVLERLLHSVALKSSFITDNLWMYAIYGGLAAGVFEEVGRWVAFRYLIKDRRPQNALMYGLGHGGAEAILLLSANMITYAVIAISAMNGGVEAVSQAMGGTTQAQALLRIIATVTPELILWGLVERLVAMTLHVSLSVAVYAAVARRRISWLFIAIGVHAFVDAAVLIIHSKFQSYWITELSCAAMVAVVFYFALRLYRSLREEQAGESPVGEENENVSPKDAERAPLPAETAEIPEAPAPADVAESASEKVESPEDEAPSAKD